MGGDMDTIYPYRTDDDGSPYRDELKHQYPIKRAPISQWFKINIQPLLDHLDELMDKRGKHV